MEEREIKGLSPFSDAENVQSFFCTESKRLCCLTVAEEASYCNIFAIDANSEGGIELSLELQIHLGSDSAVSCITMVFNPEIKSSDIILASGMKLEKVSCKKISDLNSGKNTVKLEDVSSNEIVLFESRNLEGDEDSEIGCLFSNRLDETLLAGDDEGNLHLVNLIDFTRLKTFKGLHSSIITGIQRFPGESLFVSSSMDKKIKLWEIKSCEKILTHQSVEVGAFEGESGRCAVGINPPFIYDVKIVDQRVFAAIGDSTIGIFEKNRKKKLDLISRFTAHNAAVSGITVKMNSKNEYLLGSIGNDSSVKLWRVLISRQKKRTSHAKFVPQRVKVELSSEKRLNRKINHLTQLSLTTGARNRSTFILSCLCPELVVLVSTIEPIAADK